MLATKAIRFMLTPWGGCQAGHLQSISCIAVQSRSLLRDLPLFEPTGVSPLVDHVEHADCGRTLTGPPNAPRRPCGNRLWGLGLNRLTNSLGTTFAKRNGCALRIEQIANGDLCERFLCGGVSSV